MERITIACSCFKKNQKIFIFIENKRNSENINYINYFLYLKNIFLSKIDYE